MQDWQMMAADRLTQLQDAVNLQAENFCNSIGALQMLAKESPFVEFNLAKVLNHNNPNETSNEASKADLNKPPSSAIKSSSKLNGTTATTVLAGTSSSGSTGEEQKDNNGTTGASKPEDNSQLFARVIARTAKDIDTLIESLPPTFESESGSSDFYSASIRQLEQENSECITRLEDVIKQGENMLQMIQAALDEIAFMQLNTPSPSLQHHSK